MKPVDQHGGLLQAVVQPPARHRQQLARHDTTLGAARPSGPSGPVAIHSDPTDWNRSFTAHRERIFCS